MEHCHCPHDNQQQVPHTENGHFTNLPLQQTFKGYLGWYSFASGTIAQNAISKCSDNLKRNIANTSARVRVSNAGSSQRTATAGQQDKRKSIEIVKYEHGLLENHTHFE